MATWPIRYADVVAAHDRMAAFLAPTPLRHYPALDRAVGHGVQVWVKHENHQPTNAFKVRNALAVLTALSPAQKQAGVVAATRGNHGQGLAWAGRRLGVAARICVPVGNSPGKNQGMRDLGAEVIEQGADYDAAIAVAQELVDRSGAILVHSTNHPQVIAGAATMTLEMLREQPELEAMVVAVGGGSQAVGALTVARELAPHIPVIGVQAAGASAIHDGWHAGHPVTKARAETFADGLATRACYELTFEALRAGLQDFVVATEEQIAQAVGLYISCTNNLAEGAGAAGLAGLRVVAPALAGRKVGIILSGGNIDVPVLRQVLAGQG